MSVESPDALQAAGGGRGALKPTLRYSITLVKLVIDIIDLRFADGSRNCLVLVVS